ncbi:hypothetical protein BGZ73_001233 [Actinomortierella ambigua]|nr:hypothetical protein BGZ73_001233 [Actinomortierella ambigua]
MVARAEEKAEKARLAKHLSAVKFEQAKLQWSQWREKILAASRERKTRADKLAQKREQEHEEESQQERILRQNTDFNRNLTLHHLMEPPVLQDTETTHIVTSSASHYHHQHIDQHQHQHQRSQPRSQHVDVYQAYGDVAAEAMEIESDVGGDETSDDEDGSITEEMPASPVIHRPRRYLGKGREDGSKGQQPQSSMTFPSELAMCRRELSSDDDGSTDRDDMDNSNTTQRVSNTPVSPTNRAIRQSRSYRSPSVHVVDDGSPEHVPIVTGTAKNKVPTFESDMSSPLFDLERGDHLSDVEEIDMIPPAVVASTPTTSNTVSLRGLEDRVMKAVQLRPSTNERDQDPRCLQQQLAISDQLSGDDDDFQRPGANTNLRQRQQYQQQKPSMSTANNRRVIVPGTPRHAWPQTPQSKPLPRARQPQLHMVHSGAQQQYEGQSNAGDLSGEDLSEIEESKIETFNLNMESTTEVSMTAANAESTRPPPTKASTSAAVRVTSSSSSSGLLATGHAPTAASSTAVEGVAAVMTNVVESALETSATTPWETMAQAEPPERIYNYTERRKYKRKQMHADDCMCCRGYYEAVGPLPRPDGYSTFFDPVPPEERAVEDPSTSHMASSRAGMISVAARRQQASRHRVQHRERLTPPGFWIVGFPTAEEREEMNRVARERAQIRDGKRNRAG